MAIEVDGDHHRKPVYYGSRNNLEVIQTRDKIKDDYCKEYFIELIRIPYNGDRIDEFKNEANKIINNIKKRAIK